MVTHPLQGLQHPSIRGNARYNNHQSSHMVSLRALHLHSNSSANQQPPETPEEGVTAPGTSSVAQMQQQPRSGVGDAVWTVWSGTQQFAGNVLSAWSSREASTGTAFDNNAASTSVPSSSGRAKLLKDAAERGRKAERTNAAKPTPNLEPYLKPVGIMETYYIRMLSNLCALTYQLDKVTNRGLWLRHQLHLVTTSKETARVFQDMPKSALQVFAEADAMGVSIDHVRGVYEELELSQQQTTQALEAIARADASTQYNKQAKQPSPTELVAAKLYEAAAAAASAAAPLANNITAFTTTVMPVHTVASTLQTAAAAGHSTAVATIATVTAAIDATWSRNNESSTSQQKDDLSPTEWFVADDKSTATRYFVIMGSDTIDHWRTNVTFDPVMFEDPSLGAMVHRGVYEAALVLYERFLPMVEEHVRANPFAKLAFTGHSLGGSIATLLIMMYVHRGVLSPLNLAPTYTFGAPAVFCEGTCCCDEELCDASSPTLLNPSPAHPRGRDAPHGVLARVGLKETSVKNIIMHKDIVPRAFACDYSSVADILRRVGDSFRDHRCLRGPQRQAMYFPVGKLMVLQPSQEMSFVKAGEGYHPSLPQRQGLFLLRQPTPASAAAAARAAGDARGVSLVVGGRGEEDTRVVPGSLTAAVNALMDTPHPLDILGDTESYGHDGGISRYHNPDHYTRAIAKVLKSNPFWRLFPAEEGVVMQGGMGQDGGRMGMAMDVPRSARHGRPFAMLQEQLPPVEDEQQGGEWII